MVSKKLSAVWAFLAFALLAVGGLTIAFSVIWSLPNDIMHFMINTGFLRAGLGLGVAYCITFVVALIAIVQPNHVIMFLAGLNWVLLVDGLATVVIGTSIWFFTLHETANYQAKWNKASPAVRTALQNKFQCCGYASSNETDIPFGGFCTDAAFASTQDSCWLDIVTFGDYTLNNIFSSIYGYMAVIVFLFLMTLCVINKRVEAERFRKIDAKRGGKGFV